MVYIMAYLACLLLAFVCGLIMDYEGAHSRQDGLVSDIAALVFLFLCFGMVACVIAVIKTA